jgi:hypothetical protein
MRFSVEPDMRILFFVVVLILLPFFLLTFQTVSHYFGMDIGCLLEDISWLRAQQARSDMLAKKLEDLKPRIEAEASVPARLAAGTMSLREVVRQMRELRTPEEFRTLVKWLHAQLASTGDKAEGEDEVLYKALILRVKIRPDLFRSSQEYDNALDRLETEMVAERAAQGRLRAPGVKMN